jgi:hypothetical protein
VSSFRACAQRSHPLLVNQQMQGVTGLSLFR